MSPRYPQDVARIRMVALAHGVVLNDEEAEAAWDDYSDSMAAGWMGLPEDDDELWWTLSSRVAQHTSADADDDPTYTPRYPEDVRRIQMVALSRRVTLSAREAESAWDAHSDDMAAGWISLPEDDDVLWANVRHHIPR